MKYITCLIIAVSMLIGTNLSAQNFDSRARLTFQNEFAKDSLLVFGASTLATDSLDRALGELYIAPFPPPSPELFVVFNWDTNDLSGKWTYIDLRSVPEDKIEFSHQYRIVMFKTATSTVTVSWSPLPNTIKSAVISDRFGGLLFSADMKAVQSVVINNQTIDKIEMYLYVTYDKKGVSVNDIDNYVESNIYPNPASNVINLNKYENIENVVIYDVFGKELIQISDKIENGIDISALPDGTYIMKINNNDHSIDTKKFIKIQ